MVGTRESFLVKLNREGEINRPSLSVNEAAAADKLVKEGKVLVRWRAYGKYNRYKVFYLDTNPEPPITK